MAKTSETAKASQCRGLIVENGSIRYRRIDSVTLFVDGLAQKTLRGDKLPAMILLDTGKSQDAETVLELFYEKLPRPTNKLSVESPNGLNGREVGMFIVGAVAGAFVFAAFVASVNSIATAMSF